MKLAFVISYKLLLATWLIPFSDDRDSHRVVVNWTCIMVTDDSKEAHGNTIKL